MRVVIVASRLCYGGAEHVGVLLANGFYRDNHEVYLLSNTNQPVTFHIYEGVRVIGIFPRDASKIVKWWRAVRILRKEIKALHPDIVIGIAETCSLISKIACMGLGVPVVYSAHNSFERPATASMGRWNKFAKFGLGHLYDAITVLTDADKKCIGNKLSNVSVMPNPLGLHPVHFIPSKQKSILSVGRLDGWHVKGFDVLIRAWALVNGQLKIDNGQLSSTGESWKLQIAGTGSEKSLNYLKQLSKENGVEDSVEFLGFRKDVEKLYQEASIFVLSSRYEGFGLVLIEAMSQGCACIACDYKGRQREIICPTPASSFSDGLRKRPVAERPRREGEPSIESQSLGTRNSKPETRNYKVEVCENGILCEPDNVEALAAGIQKMIEDKDYRESVRAKAIERSKYYSLENTIDRWEKLFDEVVN